ncbi:MAG: hypothetical protein V4559_15560 [Pseudomonadota bacterium]
MEDSKCSSWMSVTQPTIGPWAKSWVDGYLTAFNRHHTDPSAQNSTLNYEGVSSWIDNYCHRDPQLTLGSAAVALAKENAFTEGTQKTTDCATWVSFERSDPPMPALLAWMMGYLTAFDRYDAVHTPRIREMPVNPMEDWITGYCIHHQTDALGMAASTYIADQITEAPH